MKKTSRLLGLALALCLLASLTSASALAEPAKPLKPENYAVVYAETGGLPPEMIGSWVGTGLGTWASWSFYPNGRYVHTNFSDPSYGSIGTSKTLSPNTPDATYVVESDTWTLNDGYVGVSHRVSMPYVRLKAEEETAAVGMDPMLIGTFGGTINRVYVEWTFHGDGRFTQVTPAEESREHGTFLAADGNLAILLNGELIQYPYTARKASISLKLPDTYTALQKKTGPLVQVPEQWELHTVESAENSYREEFAKTGGWVPESIGSWVGYFMGSWGCWSFYKDGRHVLTNFDAPSVNAIGTSKTLESADGATYETNEKGEFWHLVVDDGDKGEFRKVSMPYVRLKAETETAAAGVDPAIIGTFGGRINGVYVEMTFHGDGRVTRVTPYLELTEHGTFLTGDGQLAVLLGGKIIQCAYTARKASISLKLPDTYTALQKRTGPLVQVPEQWNID